MKIKILLLFMLLYQYTDGMESSSSMQEAKQCSGANMLVAPLQQIHISKPATAVNNKVEKKASEIPLTDILAEPLTKARLLNKSIWQNLTSGTAKTIFEALCHPTYQMDYRILRDGIAAALYLGVSPKHEFMGLNFFTAVNHDDVNLVKLMLNKQVDGINSTLCGLPPIFLASSPGMAYTLKVCGANLKQKVRERNLLHTVFRYQYDPGLVHYYMMNGIDPEDIDDQGLSSFDYFTKYKNSYPRELARDYLLSFLRAGIPSFHPFIERHYIDAIIDGDEELVKFLLKKEVNPNAIMNGQRAISYASTEAMAEILYKAGANIDTSCTTNGNLIHTVLKKRYQADLIPYYAERGISLEDTDENGQTPLDYFCENNYSKEEAEEYILAFLIADINKETISEKLQRVYISTLLKAGASEQSINEKLQMWSTHFEKDYSEDTTSEHTASTSTNNSSAESLSELING